MLNNPIRHSWIVVSDIKGVWDGESYNYPPLWPEKFKVITVEAECVGGIDGILAFFIYEDKFCISSGDDGIWILNYTCDIKWKDEIKRTLLSLIKQIKKSLLSKYPYNIMCLY